MLNHQAVPWQHHDSIIYGGVLILALGAIGGAMTRRSIRGRDPARRRGFPGPTKGSLVMMTMMTLSLFAVALAFPGLITALMSRTAHA